MAKYRVYGTVTGTKYLGEFEADSKEEALELGLESEENYVGLCHQCSKDLELSDWCCHGGEAELIEGGDVTE